MSLDRTAASMAATLEVLEGATNYRDWILSLAEPWLDGPILEIGAGHGTYTQRLIESGHVHCVEPSGHGSDALHQRFGDDRRVTITAGSVEEVDAGQSFATAVAINVLEHIEDDLTALRTTHRLLLPGGHLILWVPAFPLLFSRFDSAVGHVRRYRRSQLRHVVEDAGFIVEHDRYANLVGWFSWLLIARLMGRTPASPRMVALWDRAVLPVIRRVEAALPPPFGQSLFLVARRPLV